MNKEKTELSRRDFFRLSGLIAISLGIGFWGCGEEKEEKEPRPFREILGGKIEGKCRLVFDRRYQGKMDLEHLRRFILSRRIREADEYKVIQGPPEWWEDYEDYCEIAYYSAEHTFSEYSPYRGKTFMKDIWPDIVYKVGEVEIGFADLTPLYQRWEGSRMIERDVNGVEWSLFSINEAIEWSRDNLNWRSDEMIVVFPYLPGYANSSYSYYFLEEDYAKERGWPAYFYNTPFLEWPTEMQTKEGLKPHNLPIWMHLAALNGEWNPNTNRWELFPNYRFGGYEDTPVYFIDITSCFAPGTNVHAPARPSYSLDEEKTKKPLSPTERIEYDWYRVWRHAFHIPSIPFWSSEKIDIRTVVIDLRGRDSKGRPEYEEGNVVDWKTFEDAILATNPYSNINFQRYYLPLDGAQREVLKDYFIRRREAKYPQHIDLRLLTRKGDWTTFHVDWHYHFDLPAFPGLVRHLAEMLADYWGGLDAKGNPLDYDPYGGPYSKSGKPFIIPAFYFLTPFKEFDGRVGGWKLDTARFVEDLFGGLGGILDAFPKIKELTPALSCWSDTYCLWWEIFTTDWAFASTPIRPNSLRAVLDSGPFNIPFPLDWLFNAVFGRFHAWSVGFPFWTRESLSDPLALELTRQVSSYHFAESIQHNMGYKHETTVIFDSPYLGMENGYDYRRHKDIGETWEQSDEQRCMPFYSTEPGSRDFMIDANTYVTHRMGAGTQHMLGRIWARREVVILYEELKMIDPTFKEPHPDYRKAVKDYKEATRLALEWSHHSAYNKAREGLSCLADYYNSKGKTRRIHADWDSPVKSQEPEVTLPPADELKETLEKGEKGFDIISQNQFKK